MSDMRLRSRILDYLERRCTGGYLGESESGVDLLFDPDDAPVDPVKTLAAVMETDGASVERTLMRLEKSGRVRLTWSTVGCGCTGQRELSEIVGVRLVEPN